MSKWTAKYTDEQRQAIEHAYCDVRIRPMAKIVRMAAAGELRCDDELVPPFEIPHSSVVYIGKAAERRRAGKSLAPHLARLSGRDAAHTLQLRLTTAIDDELARFERQRKKRPNSPIDMEQVRKTARALRELATIPDPHEKRLPRTPGEPDANGQQPDGATRDSLAGKLLAASDASVSPSARASTPGPAPEEHLHNEPQSERESERLHGDGTIAVERKDDGEHGDESAPYQAPREQSAALSASGVTVAVVG